MRSYRVEYAEFRKDFDSLIKSASRLPVNTTLFVTDHTGTIKCQRGVDKYDMLFPCLLRFVAKSDRYTCLADMFYGKSGIYRCAFDEAEFISVQVCEGRRTKCAVVNFSEKDCKKAREYLSKLYAGRNYIEDFVNVASNLGNYIGFYETYEEKIAAITELINFSITSDGRVEDILAFDFLKFIDKICEWSRFYGDDFIVKRHPRKKVKSFLCEIPISYPMALLYAIAYLLKNSEGLCVEIDFRESVNGTRVCFSTRYTRGINCDLYIDILEKVFSTYEPAPFFSIENEEIKLVADFVPYGTSHVSVREPSEDMYEALEQQIFSEEAFFAFRLVSGL